MRCFSWSLALSFRAKKLSGNLGWKRYSEFRIQLLKLKKEQEKIWKWNIQVRLQVLKEARGRLYNALSKVYCICKYVVLASNKWQENVQVQCFFVHCVPIIFLSEPIAVRLLENHARMKDLIRYKSRHFYVCLHKLG